jgi:hypothetical protein
MPKVTIRFFPVSLSLPLLFSPVCFCIPCVFPLYPPSHPDMVDRDESERRAQEAERCARLFASAKYDECLSALKGFEALLKGQHDPRVRLYGR